MGTAPNTPHETSKNQYFHTFHTHHRHGEDVLVCRRTVSHPQVRLEWEKRIKELNILGNEHLLTPIRWAVVEKSLCGSGQIVEIEYDNFPATLTELIAERSLKGEYFDQTQLWYMLLTLARVGRSCHSLGQRIGDIRPENVLLNNDREIKVLTFLSFPNELKPFMDRDSQNFFSPEELDQLKKGCMENMTDPIKSQSFSIGLTLLSMGMLHEMHSLYLGSQDHLNEALLKRYLLNLQNVSYTSHTQSKKSKYTKQLCDIINCLLQINPEHRIGYNLIYQQLQPYSQDIEEFKPITFKLDLPKTPEIMSPNGKVIALRSKQQKSNMQSPNSLKTPQSVSPNKKIIPLRSSHRNIKLQKSHNQGQQKSKDKVLDRQSPVVESRYIGGVAGGTRVGGSVNIVFNSAVPAREVKEQGRPQAPLDVLSLLSKIDGKLKRSREQFPS